METTALLREAREGSDAALGALLERCGGRLLGFVRARMAGRLRAREETGDVLNAVLLKAFEHLGEFRGDDGRALLGWMMRIAENEIRDLADHHGRLRRDVRREEALSSPDVAALAARVRSQTSRLVLREDAERALRALDRLSPDHREVIVLRRLQELGWEEVGRRMGRAPDACRMLLARALAALALEMERPA